ncbi:unnamed protein product [Ambrosiozyma monospora]|uniref:Unnamed protein product n=1 Tax=Ambrosiozyma monospora TaxID=43982 RepID=A0A9W6Z0L1_AMBMO|nr:unnamed protein product [Ambrosiozyma monospora]
MDFDDSLDDIPAVRVKRHLRQRQLQQQQSQHINYRESDDNEEEYDIDDNEDDDYTANTSITNRSSSRHRSSGISGNSVHSDHNDDAINKQKSRDEVDKTFVNSLAETNVSKNLEMLASTNYESKNRIRLFSHSSASPSLPDASSTDTTNVNEQVIKQEDQGLEPEQRLVEPQQQSEPDQAINNEGKNLPIELDYLDSPEDLENYQRLLTSEYSKLSRDFASSTTQRIDELIGLVDLTIDRTKQDYLSFKRRVENSKDNLEHRKAMVERARSKHIQLSSSNNNKNQSSSNNSNSRRIKTEVNDGSDSDYEPMSNPYSNIITPESLAKFRLPHLPQFPIFNSFFQDLMAPKYEYLQTLKTRSRMEMELVDSITAKECGIVELQLKRAIKENREHVRDKLVDDMRVLDQEFAFQQHRQWLLNPGSVNAAPPPSMTNRGNATGIAGHGGTIVVPPISAPVPGQFVPPAHSAHVSVPSGPSVPANHTPVNISPIPVGVPSLSSTPVPDPSTADPTETNVVVINDEPEVVVEPVGEKLLADDKRTKKLNHLFEDGNGLLSALANVVCAIDEKENPEYYTQIADGKKVKADWASEKYRRSREVPYDKSKYEHVIVID